MLLSSQKQRCAAGQQKRLPFSEKAQNTWYQRSADLLSDGEHIEEDFLDKEHMESEMRKYSRSIFTADLSVTLGEDEYFCMGDNRIVSADSRVYGPVSSKDIISSGILVFFPFDHLGIAD